MTYYLCATINCINIIYLELSTANNFLMINLNIHKNNPQLLLLSLLSQSLKQETRSKQLARHTKQFVFTYIDTRGNINKPLHADYLNNKMKSIRKRHKELAHATPHKLRHTGATLAKQAGFSLEIISEALTHSDKEITKTYVNTKDTVNQTVGDIAFRSLK